MTTVVLAPDKFRGSLSASQVARHLAIGLLQAAPELTVHTAPVADGGEGTVEAALSSGYEPRTVTVRGPLGDPVAATFAVRGDTAVVELAQASGLQHVTGERRPLQATSYGTGQLVTAALDAGCRTIVLGIGGSASTDGGAGLLAALGAEVRTAGGGAVQTLADVSRVGLAGLDPRLRQSSVTLAGDVANPLYGPDGAAAVFGPQKGASGDEVAQLNDALRHWAGLIAAEVGTDHALDRGAGAAGGVGFAALAVLGATFRPGIELLLELLGVDRLLAGADLVITGEGSLDSQTLQGKAPLGVCAAAARYGVPTVAVAGRTTLSAAELAEAGFAATYTLQHLEPDLEQCMARAGELLQTLAGRIAQDRRLGNK